jgi:hypothetical protein
MNVAVYRLHLFPPLSVVVVVTHPLNLGWAANLYIAVQDAYSSYLYIPFDPSKICNNKS